MSSLRVVPCSRKQANDYVRRFHRHHAGLPSDKFCCAVTDSQGMVRGVAIVGLPKARMLATGLTLEVNRICTDGWPNACSFLYGACRRIAKEFGYSKLITYTLESEPGTSLKASGWQLDGVFGGGDWWTPNQRAKGRFTYHTTSPTGMKKRWSIQLNESADVIWPEPDPSSLQQLSIEESA